MIEDHKQLKPTVLSCEGSSEQFVLRWSCHSSHNLFD
jgi:hypothetical protein